MGEKTDRAGKSRLEQLQERKAKIEAQLKALEARDKAAQRKADTRRKIIVGGAVLAHAALHPAFAESLREALRAAVTRDMDKKAIADLLDFGDERMGELAETLEPGMEEAA